MGMSWCRLGYLLQESRMVLCVVLGRFGAGDVCQLGYGFIPVWRRGFIILFLGNEIQEKAEDDASVM